MARLRTGMAIAAAGAVALAGCGSDDGADGAATTESPTSSSASGNGDSGSGSPSTSDSTSSSPGTSSSSAQDSGGVGDSKVFAKAEKAARASVEWDPMDPIPKSATWASDAYRQEKNATLDKLKSRGITIKGKNTVTGVRPEVSDRGAPGGWDVTMWVCTKSTERAYKDGKDVTADKNGNPMPKGERKQVFLFSFVTPDDGQTWQVSHWQEESKKKSCDG